MGDLEVLIDELKKRYPDKMLLEPTEQHKYWKYAGKIELIKEIELMVNNDEVNKKW